jgi:FtsP/CotA-like multicopper oxidase with cupredoxin domain
MKTSALIKTAVMSALLVSSVGFTAQAATINKTLGVRSITKTMSDGASVTFWVYCGPTPTLPGPQIEVGVGDTLNLTLNFMGGGGCSGGGGGFMESPPYNGHTIHMHGADVKTSEDGVPETGASVMGDTYTFSPDSKFAGTDLYHCHVHTVKHLEMGMYGALVVRPKNASGAFLNQLTQSSASAYDYVQTYLFSTVDPAYHTATGDSTVFADYNPKYFLISGNEGKTTAAPAITLAATVNKKVALRLAGLHSVNSTFSLGGASFTIYSRDGKPLATPQTVSVLDLAPGQRADIIFTTPSTSGTTYPRVEYKSLRNNALLSVVYGKVTY